VEKHFPAVYTMTPERYQRICQLFDEALELAPEQRAAFLDETCGDDVALRAEVEKLLAGMETTADYLSRPAMDVAAEMLAQQQQQPPSVLGQQISHYQIIALLGAGGMGRVFLARDTRLGWQVALKLLPTQYTQDQQFSMWVEILPFSFLIFPAILNLEAEGDIFPFSFLPRRFPAATREAAPKNEAGKGKNEEFQLRLRIAVIFHC
jgi:hypothetical protein